MYNRTVTTIAALTNLNTISSPKIVQISEFIWINEMIHLDWSGFNLYLMHSKMVMNIIILDV